MGRGVNAQLTFSTGAAGLVEKPKRSFTDVLEGFCNKEFKKREKRICLSTPNADLERYLSKCTRAYLRSGSGILGGLRVYSEKGSQTIFDRLLQRCGRGLL